MKARTMIAIIAASALIVARLVAGAETAKAHDIYTGVYAKGQLCCGGSDCAATTYREDGDRYEFLTREAHWVRIPQERITFLPIPGDKATGDHLAHLCYRAATDFDRGDNDRLTNVFGDIYLYCAFIPPGGA